MCKFISFCLFSFCFLSCKDKATEINAYSEIKNNLLMVIINQTKNTNEQFKYFDYYGSSQLASFPKTDTLKIKGPHSVVAYYAYTGDFSDLTYYTISPADTIYIKMKGVRQVLTSNNKVLASKMDLMSRLFFNIGSMNYSRHGNFETDIKSINNFYLDKKHIVESYKNNIDSLTLKEANDIIKFDKLASLIAIQTQFNKKNDTLLTWLKKADTTAWNYLTFRNVIANYCIYIKKVYNIKAADAFVKYIRASMPLDIQDYVIFYYLNSFKPDDKNKLDTLNTLVKAFDKYSIHKDLAVNLSVNLEKYNNNFAAKDSKTVALLATNNKPISLDQLLNKHKGEIIYIDFWASWCGPCLGEMPHSFALSQVYSVKKAPIVFLYFSTDVAMASWVNKLKDLKIPDDKSFIVLQNETYTNFCSKYKLNTIPRYMIIGKKGK